MERIEATYRCPNHGFFTLEVRTNEPPVKILCPHCMGDSNLTNVAFYGNSQLGDINEAIAQLRRRPQPPATPELVMGAGVGGGSKNDLARRKKILPASPIDVPDSQLEAHEIAQRAIMESEAQELASKLT